MATACHISVSEDAKLILSHSEICGKIITKQAATYAKKERENWWKIICFS